MPEEVPQEDLGWLKARQTALREQAQEALEEEAQAMEEAQARDLRQTASGLKLAGSGVGRGQLNLTYSLHSE